MNIPSLFLWLCAILFPVCLAGQTRLLDEKDRSPVPYAQLVDEDGLTVGWTDDEGMIPPLSVKGQITIQHLSYHSKTVSSERLSKPEPVTLSPKTYTLREVNVTSKGQEYIHLRTYFRCYQLDYDQRMKYYEEGFADFFIRLKNRKSKRYVTQFRRLTNTALLHEDSLECLLMIPSLGKRTVIERLRLEGWTYDEDLAHSPLRRDNLQGGMVVTDTVRGIRLVKSDWLAGERIRKIRFLGMSLHINDLLLTESYRYRKGYQSFLDMLNWQEYFNASIKYKKFSARFETMRELYVLDREYLSADEMKACVSSLRRSSASRPYPDASIVSPLNEPLQATLKTMVEEGR